MKKFFLIATTLANCCFLHAQSQPAKVPKTAVPLAASPATSESGDKKLVIYNEKMINTPQLEFSPTFYEDGIVFISSQVPIGTQKVLDEQINRKTMSIYAAFRGENGKLLAPKLFADELVSLLHEGPLTFDQFNENVYFTRNNSKGTKTTYVDGVSRLKIYTARRDKKAWVDVTELPFNDEKSDACHPTISIDGKRLYFSSNRQGGYGGMDLYVCEKINGKWGQPTNLGSKINTAKNETFPYIHNNGLLFFASDGLKGLGGIDVFYARPLGGGEYDVPKNLGKAFNTNKDDFGLIVDADLRNGYFASSRAGGVGEDDIYSFNAPTGLLNSITTDDFDDVASKNGQAAAKSGLTTVHVLDRKTGQEIQGAAVSVMNLNEISVADLMGNSNDFKIQLDANLPVDSSNTKIVHIETDAKGEAKTKITKGNKYIINVLKPSYSQRQIILKEDDTRTDIILLLDKTNDNLCVSVNGNVVDKYKRPVVGALVHVVDSRGDSMLVTSDGKGRFKTCIKCNDNFKFQATKNATLSDSKLASTTVPNCNALTPPLPIVLEMPDIDDFEADLASGNGGGFNVGDVYRLQNIYYNYNDASIRPDATRDLDNLAATMKKFPDLEIELSSHTDIRGTDEYNKDLSQRRANNAVLYLVKKGVDRNRVKAVGYGEAKLKVKCTECTNEEHQKNRRTEVKILKGTSKTKIKVLDKQTTNFTGNDK